jgi:hypothetical protein
LPSGETDTALEPSVEAGGGLDLLDEALGAKHGGQLRLEDLEGDLAVVPEVLGQVDGGHPTLAELAIDAVAVGQRRDESGKGVSHHGRLPPCEVMAATSAAPRAP